MLLKFHTKKRQLRTEMKTQSGLSLYHLEREILCLFNFISITMALINVEPFLLVFKKVLKENSYLLPSPSSAAGHTGLRHVVEKPDPSLGSMESLCVGHTGVPKQPRRTGSEFDVEVCHL